MNLGNPDETSIAHFATRITAMVHSHSLTHTLNLTHSGPHNVCGDGDGQVNPGGSVVYMDAKKDDPRRRRPDISLAKRVLGWAPRVSVEEVIVAPPAKPAVLSPLTLYLGCLCAACVSPTCLQGLVQTIKYFREELDPALPQTRTWIV